MDKLSETLRLQQSVLSVRAHRQELIGSNIANSDTPGYKARDVDFKETLANVMGGAKPARTLARTNERHMTGNAGSLAGTPTMYRTEHQSSVDGNTVDVDGERARFTENAVQTEAGMTFITHQFKALVQAIQGQ